MIILVLWEDYFIGRVENAWWRARMDAERPVRSLLYDPGKRGEWPGLGVRDKWREVEVLKGKKHWRWVLKGREVS